LFKDAVKAVERIVAEVGVATVLAGSVKVMAAEWRRVGVENVWRHAEAEADG
jgi:hypothetical protein